MAHFKTGGPAYDDALSRLDDTQGPSFLMLPTNLAAALRQELDSCDGLRVGWEAVAEGNLLALLHRDALDECQCGMLAPHLTGSHVYMATPPPQGQPRAPWDDLIAAFHDHGILPDDTWHEVRQKTLGRDYRRRVRARLLEIAPPPPRQRWDDLWLRRLGPWSPPSHLPHTPATSAGNATRCPPQRRRAPTGARSAPRWPRAPGPSLPRARTGARRRRLCTGASGEHTLPHTNARAPRAPPSCGSTCTCGTPRPSRTCRTC